MHRTTEPRDSAATRSGIFMFHLENFDAVKREIGVSAFEEERASNTLKKMSTEARLFARPREGAQRAHARPRGGSAKIKSQLGY